MSRFTSKDTVIKETRDCVLTDRARCKQILPYTHNHWEELRAKNSCVCVDDKIAIPNSIRGAFFDAIHATHPGTRKLGHDRYGNTYIVAIHASRSAVKNKKV